MKGLQVFNYADNEVRTILKDGEPWFVLKDVCEVLGLSNPSMIADRLDGDERAKFNLGRQGETNIINESGLYNVIIRSDKPEAKAFKRWITHDVLPSIRKTGSYDIHSNPQREVEANARLMNAKSRMASTMLKIAQHEAFPKEYKHVLLSYASNELMGKGTIPLPKVEEKTYTATEIGAMFGKSANAIGKLANANGLKTEQYGLEVWDKSKYSSKEVPTFRYNDDAVTRFRELMGDNDIQ